MSSKYKIFSLNARGLANAQKRRAIFEKHRKTADILILQESHSTKDIELIWESEWGGKIIFSHGSSAARGIMVLTSKSIYNNICNVETDEDGRLIVFDLKTCCSTISVGAIYAPNEDNPAFFQQLELKLLPRHEHKIIIGDFNLAMDVDLDRLNTYNNNNRAKQVIEDICSQFYLLDIWRIRNMGKKEYSWIKKNSYPNKASRIDFALVSGGLDQYIQMTQYVSSIYTDHRGLYLLLEVLDTERGTGYWKLNNSLLQDAKYIEQMNQEIRKSIISAGLKEPKEKWEIIKQRIKSNSIDYSRKKARDDRLVIAQLTEKVNEYESRLPLVKDENDALDKTKADLEEATLERIKGVMFRSKVQWYEQGERSSKYFYALEKTKYNAKTCYKLLTEDGEEIVDPKQILNKQRVFYQDLYSVDEDVNFTLQNSFGVRVPENIVADQDTQISLADLQEAIKTMNNNKTPGEDGIPVDFYKVFWNELKGTFYEMVAQVYETTSLHATARQGILNLIPKATKDTRYIKNLRPITLLNTDYKIIEKAIANKMIPALKHIIHTDQRGFMKDRRISVNIRKMLDIIHMAKQEDIEGVVLSLDFVKCFDKCSFSILHGSLDFFGFGQIVKAWTKILYTDFTVKIQNNGNFSDKIKIQKGVHQGGCCSSVYFLVIAEILALSLRANSDIDGITLQEIRNLLNQFADDMDIFSLCNEQSLKAIFSELECFRKQSGFTLSYEKTTLYRIGSLRHSSAAMYDISQVVWSCEDITVLGVTISHEDVTQKNYDSIIEKAKNTLQCWENRGLSLIGKVQVVNTLVASLLVYKMMVLPQIPKLVCKKLENIIREFLWNGKKSKIAYNILQNQKDQGGLNLVNLKNKDTALKATWPKILAEESEYAKLVYSQMRCSEIGATIWRCSLKPEDVVKLKIKSQFWEDVLRSWCEYNWYKNHRIENQYLWYNSNILVKGKPFFWADVYSKGLQFVFQLFKDGNYKTKEQVSCEYGLTVLRFNALKTAIPKEWKEYFCSWKESQFSPLPPHNYDMCVNNTIKGLSKRVYQFLSDDIMLVHGKYMKWRQDIDSDFCEGLWDFRRMFIDVYRVTNVPKYRSFQYRLLQRALVTNVELKKWGIVESDRCTFCELERETLKHLLFECKYVQSLWTQLVEFLQQNYCNQILNLSISTVIFNKMVDIKGHVVNFVCLIAKQYVYRKRCQKDIPSFVELKRMILSIQNVEKYIAVKNNKLSTHLKKWGNPVDLSIQNFIMRYIENVDQ